MGQALYRKYRSRSLDEIIGQEHVTKTLKSAIEQGRISHAYLFTGPRGVGKTSIARILAHEINQLPYKDDSVHIDIIEIDAASNRRIDEIRELRDKVNIAPTSAKYKVYIIDEVHMLTKEAFNALLKTLEEPPAHVVFILATTDAHKLPDTIVSRTQRFSFKPVEKSKVKEHLSTICKAEGLKASDDALDLLAEHGEGSFRDSISLLDQASSQAGKLELSDVQNLLGIPSDEAINQLLRLITQSNNAAELMRSLDSLYGQGFQASSIAKQLSRSIRAQITNKSLSISPTTSISLLSSLIKVPSSPDPERFLELCLLDIADMSDLRSSGRPEPKKVQETPQKETKLKPETKTTSSSPSKSVGPDIWPDVLTELKQKHNTLYGVVRMAEPTFEGENLRLAFAFPFHQKRSNESANRQKIADIVLSITGQSVAIECVVDDAAQPPKITVSSSAPRNNESLSTISNIFGEAELLES